MTQEKKVQNSVITNVSFLLISMVEVYHRRSAALVVKHWLLKWD